MKEERGRENIEKMYAHLNIFGASPARAPTVIRHVRGRLRFRFECVRLGLNFGDLVVGNKIIER